MNQTLLLLPLSSSLPFLAVAAFPIVRETRAILSCERGRDDSESLEEASLNSTPRAVSYGPTLYTDDDLQTEKSVAGQIPRQRFSFLAADGSLSSPPR